VPTQKLQVMKLLLVLLCLFALSCNSKKHTTETTKPQTPQQWYSQFVNKNYDYTTEYKNAINIKGLTKHTGITITDSTLLGVIINYIAAPPKQYYTMAVYANGNATKLIVNASNKNEIIQSNNEANVRTAVQNMLQLACGEIAVFKSAATNALAEHSDQVVFTIITTTGIFERKVPMSTIDEGMSSMRPLFDSMDEVSNALKENSEAALSKTAK
jgi:hypothetical protein